MPRQPLEVSALHHDDASAAIQAAVRGNQARQEQRQRSAWLHDVSSHSRVLTPRDLGDLGGGRMAIPDALLGTTSRQSAVNAASRRVRDAKELNIGKASTARPSKGRLPDDAKRPTSRPGLPSRSSAASAKSAPPRAEPEWRRANKEFVMQAVLGPMIDRAARLGEGMIAARKRQAEFERRPLQKPVCVASLFGTGGVSGDAHSVLSVVEQDGICLVSSRNELQQLSLHTAPLPQLGLAPLVRQSEQQAAELPSTAALHSVAVDASAARVFALHADGCMLVWGARHGDLRHSAQLLPSVAMAAAPSQPLLAVDEESQLVLLDCSWHDGTVRVLEPLSLDVLAAVSVSLPNEPPGTRRLHNLLYIECVQLIACAFEGTSQVIGFDGGNGEPRCQLGGHSGSPPLLRWLLRLQRLATLGGGSEPFGDDSSSGDCSIRLWKLVAIPPAKGSLADGPAGVEATCERVLLGHTAGLTDATFLPDSNLLVTCAHDRSIRFWDVEAVPHPLTAPEGGAHVRVGPGQYEPMRPEWTVTNPPYVNCLVLHTQDAPIALGAASGWHGPEGLAVLTAHTQPRRGQSLLGPPPSALPAQGGTVALWAVTRTFTTVEAKRFDEVLSKSTYSELEATAARDWREALQRLREAEAGLSDGFRAERKSFDAGRVRTMELLRASSLQRPALTSTLDEGSIKRLFAHAVSEAIALESRARGRSVAGTPSLSLTQVYSLAREHQLLCAPLNNLQAMRRWLIELREFKPSLESRVAPLQAPQAAALGVAESNAARVSEFAFGRLLNDLDPIARLRDTAFELSMHTTQLSLKLPAPRHAARHAAEARALRWEHLGDSVVRSLDALHAHLRSHALGFVRQMLVGLLTPPAPPHAPRARPPPPEMPPPRPPPYEVDRASTIASAMEPPRVVFEASETSGGGGIGCVAVLPQRCLLPQKLGGRPLAEHLALEVAASRSLADACELFTRSVGYVLAPPSVRQREHEAHVLFEPPPKGTPLPELLGTNGPLQVPGGLTGSGGGSRSGDDDSAMHLKQVLALWGRQLLLAMQAAHRRGILLRTLRLSHIVVSPDGQRIKLGPSALANFALADGTMQDGGGRLLSANDLPPLEGPLTDALTVPTLAEEGLAVSGQPPSNPSALGASPSRTTSRRIGKAAGGSAKGSEWGMSAFGAHAAGGTPILETLLPPELLAKELLPDGDSATLSAAETEHLSAACDVWHVGQFLFEAYYGQPPASYPQQMLKHCEALGLEPRAALHPLLRSVLEPLPSHHKARASDSWSEPSMVSAEATGDANTNVRALKPVAPFTYDPFADLKASAVPSKAGQWNEGEDMSAPLSDARSHVDAAQLPSVSLHRAMSNDSGAQSDPVGVPGLRDGRAQRPSSTKSPEVADVIAACLQAHPAARPTVDSLLACKLFSIDQSTLLSAKRNAALYVRLPQPKRFVEHRFGGALRELHELRIGSGHMPSHNFEQLLQRVLNCCTSPLTALHGNHAAAAHGTAYASGSAATVASRDASDVPTTAAEAETCRELMVELIERADVWGCLRFTCLHDIHAQVEAGEQLPRTDLRCSCLLRLGRALRTAIAHADVSNSFLRPHIGTLLYQLVCLGTGDVSLQPAAILAEAWHPSHMRSPALALASKVAQGTDERAAEKAAVVAAAAAAAAAGGGATGGGVPPVVSGGVRLSPSELYTSLVHRLDGDGAAWQYYAPQTSRRWSPTLQAALHPIIDAVISEDGGGSFSLPSLRETLRSQTAAAAKAAVASPGALKYDVFTSGTADSRGEARGGLPRNRALTRGYCAEVVAALASLRSLQPSPIADYGREARRARSTALTHFAGMLRRRPALRLCVDLQLPQHAYSALADPEVEVRVAALDLFLKIAELKPGAASDDEVQSPVSLLLGCFGQHAMMHGLARPLHDPSEVRAVRSKAVELMGILAVSDNPTVLTAMSRANVWGALVALVPPAKVAGENQLVDLGARAVFEKAAREGPPQMLAYVHARPAMRQRLIDLGLRMPPPATLAALGTRARATLIAEGDDAGLPPPPPPAPAQHFAPLAVAAAAGGVRGGAMRAAAMAAETVEMQRSASERRGLEHALAAEIEAEGPATADAEQRLLVHAGACLRQPWVQHGGDAASQRSYLHGMLVLAVKRAERAHRTLYAAAERDAERLFLGEAPLATAAKSSRATDSRRGTTGGSNPLSGSGVPSPNQTPNETRAVAARAVAVAAATAAAEASAEATLLSCMRLFDAAWLVRASAAVDARGVCMLSGAVQWIVRTALPPNLPGAPDVSDPHYDPSTASSAAAYAFSPLGTTLGAPGGSGMLAPRPSVLSETCQLPLLRTQRAAAELLASMVLRSATLPLCASLIDRMGVGRGAVDTLQRQQHELGAALNAGEAVSRLFLQEYDASRERRLALWDALLRAPGDQVAAQLRATNAVDRLILTGALPYTRSFELPLLKLPPSFVPHHGGMALRQEGLLMLSALLSKRSERPDLFEQLLHALQRDRMVPREIARLTPALAGGRRYSAKEEELFGSVVTLMMLLDSARDLRLWQLLQEADAARTIHSVYLTCAEAPPVPLERLLEPGVHSVQRPLGRAAAAFIEGLREYERTTCQIHPLMTGAMRGGV